ncbi:MAG: helix-turn-helix domain-containing protein, partial [Thermoanaerobaculia bacterium]
STNADIYKLMEENKFRKDLFYRINVLSFKIPSLKERKDDISLLASLFLKEFSKQYEKNITAITQEALSLLINKDWTGNIRELRNTIERAVILCNDKRIKPEDLPTDIFIESSVKREFLDKKLTLEEMEKEYIKEMLQFFKNNNTKTAKALGISRKTLILKRKKFGI